MVIYSDCCIWQDLQSCAIFTAGGASVAAAAAEAHPSSSSGACCRCNALFVLLQQSPLLEHELLLRKDALVQQLSIAQPLHSASCA